MRALGLGKTIFNTSVCLLNDPRDFEIVLTERITRDKGASAWPVKALEHLKKNNSLKDCIIAENRDVDDTVFIEDILDSRFPFYDSLKQKDLIHLTRKHNPQIKMITHHLAHANAATCMSPFGKALIIVIDGAGSRLKNFTADHPERKLISNEYDEDSAEERSVYLLDQGKLTCVKKRLQTFIKSKKAPEHFFSEGLGTFYEKVSEYIFNSKRSAGKVMGLAALGKPSEAVNGPQFLEKLDWSKAFKGKSKKDWENSAELDHYKNVAATVQAYFEKDLISFVQQMRAEFPKYENLILTGGCALNCTTNMKIIDLGIYKNLYVPPFPGDECISLGTAYAAYSSLNNHSWKPFSFEQQHGYFGPKDSVLSEDEVRKIFAGYKIENPSSIEKFCAEKLNEGKIIGWYQGRSESGPRALGNRSILANPKVSGLKQTLNAKIKFRESFRPYGCSALFEKAPLYFKIPDGFNNPYMSFATVVNEEYKDTLKEVTHDDGTSRMQTVRSGQNSRFHTLISEFGDISGLYCLLNTSLNVMGEPIVESVADAKNFLDNVPVDGIAINNLFISKTSS